MPFLPDPIALVLTWGLCLFLLLWLCPGLVPGAAGGLARMRAGQEEGVAAMRGDPHGQALNRAAIRAVDWALLALPLSVIAAKAFTSEPILGIFKVFRDDPAPMERIGRSLLVILLFIVLRALWTREPGPGKGLAAKVTHTAPAAIIAVFWLTGLTMGFVLHLMWLIVLLHSLGQVKAETERVKGPVVLISALLGMGAFAAFYWVLGLVMDTRGLQAVALHQGVILPLAVVPGLVLGLWGAGWAAEHVFWQRAGLGAYVLRAGLAGILGAVLTGLGLMIGVGVLGFVGPEAYQPHLAALWTAGLGDPAVGGMFWILGLVTLAPALWPWAQGARAALQPKGMLAALLR